MICRAFDAALADIQQFGGRGLGYGHRSSYAWQVAIWRLGAITTVLQARHLSGDDHALALGQVPPLEVCRRARSALPPSERLSMQLRRIGQDKKVVRSSVA
jgi:hypothetical protein